MSWVFNLRSYNPRDTDDSESGDEADPPNKLTESEKLWSDLDLSARPDNATYKPDPWTIAKINAASRRTEIVSDSGKPPPLTGDQAGNKAVVSPKRRQPSIFDAFKKAVERQPSSLHHPVSKPTQTARNSHPQTVSSAQGPDHTLLERPPTPIVAINSPTNTNAAVSLSFQPANPNSDAITRGKDRTAKNSFQPASRSGSDCNLTANSTATSAHIATDSAQTHPLTIVGPSEGIPRFPPSFSSPIRLQSPANAFSSRCDVLPLPNSSPARPFHDRFIHNAQNNHFNYPLHFPHTGRTSAQVLPNQTSTEYSKFKKPFANVDDLHPAEQHLPSLPQHPSGLSRAFRPYTSSNRGLVPLHSSGQSGNIPFQRSNEMSQNLSNGLSHEETEAQSPGSLSATLHASTSDYSLEIHGLRRTPKTCHPPRLPSGLPNNASTSYLTPTGTNSKRLGLDSFQHLPNKKRLASRLERISPPRKRANPVLQRDPDTSFSMPESDPDSEWTTLPTRNKVKSLQATSSKANFKTKTSGTFRLPTTLMKNHSGTEEVMNSSAVTKPRVVMYLPPPKAPVNSEASDVKSLNGTDTSETEVGQTVATSEVPSNLVSSTSIFQTPHHPPEDDIGHFDISEVMKKYPATRLLMSKVRR